MVIMEVDFKLLKAKIANSASSPSKAKQENVRCRILDAVAIFEGFRERSTSFSLGYLAIGPLDFDGARRRNVLREAGYAWTPGLRVFDNSKR